MLDGWMSRSFRVASHGIIKSTGNFRLSAEIQLGKSPASLKSVKNCHTAARRAGSSWAEL